MNIDERVSKLEKLVNALIKRTDLDKFYQNADIEAERKGINDNTEAINDNTASIADSEEAICEIDESMTQRMTDIEEALCELSGGEE